MNDVQDMRGNSALVEKLKDYLVGSNSIAADNTSITEIFENHGYTNKPYLFDYSDALAVIESAADGVGECPCCEWVCDDLYNYHSEHDSVCSDCQEEEEE